MSAREIMLHLIITFDDSTGPHLIVPDALAPAFVWGPDEVLTTYGHWVLVRTHRVAVATMSTLLCV